MGVTMFWRLKEERVHLISDGLLPNQQSVKRQEYPLPTIDELFQDIKGFEFASVIDLNTGYLLILLTDESKALLTIVTMFGFLSDVSFR